MATERKVKLSEMHVHLSLDQETYRRLQDLSDKRHEGNRSATVRALVNQATAEKQEEVPT